MKLLRFDCQLTALFGVGICFFAFSKSGHVRGRSAESRQDKGPDSLPDSAQVRTCTEVAPHTLLLQGASQSFQFKCPTGLKLCPVEQDSESSRSGEPAAKGSNKIYQWDGYTSSAKSGQGRCVRTIAQLDGLVPGSSLKVPEGEAESPVVRSGADARVFTLTLGPALSGDKHFCYICSASCSVAAANGAPAVSRTKECTIYVTVPKVAEKPSPPTNPKPEDQQPSPQPEDQQPSPQPEDQQPSPQPDQPSGYKVSSPSLLGWLTASAAGSAFNFMVHF